MVIPPRVALQLLEQIGRTARGSTLTVVISDAAELEDALRSWCAAAGHHLIRTGPDGVTLRRGPLPDPLAGLPPERRPGTRIWLYTNFDCNLACDYCCTRSSPRAPRRALGLERIRLLAEQAAEAGAAELLITGGEPFLLPDIDAQVHACTAHLPTTLLTNGMLFRGERLAGLRRMDRERLTLQISLDADHPGPHDAHRGARSWDKALAGIRIAQEEGFRVRVAATVTPGALNLTAFRSFLDELGIAPEDQLIRAVARQGFAGDGLHLSPETLVPEVTVTADGIYWHPVAAADDGQLVTREILPLAPALQEVTRRFSRYRAAADAAAQWFPCA